MALAQNTTFQCYRGKTFPGQPLGIFKTSYTGAICPGSRTSEGHYRCCAVGDYCLGDNFCHNAHSPAADASGYYVNSCTDSSYEDSDACTPLCTETPLPDVTYLQASGLWTCCGADSSGAVNCQEPTNYTFLSLPPAQLLDTSTLHNSTEGNSTVTASPSSGSATATANATATATATGSANASSSSMPSPSGTHLGAGPIVGIVVGALILIALVIAGVWLTRRNKKKEVVYDHLNVQSSMTKTDEHLAAPAPTYQPPNELDTQRISDRRELE